jgi:hypothetical protein
MLRIEANTHSFLVRLWLEETSATDGRVVWRGHITHVASREKRYVSEVDELILVIVPYLQEMGVQLSWQWRLCQWLKRMGRSLKARKR